MPPTITAARPSLASWKWILFGATFTAALIVLVPSWVVTSSRMSSFVCAKQKQTGIGCDRALRPTWATASDSSTTSVLRKNTALHAGFAQYRHDLAAAVGRCARTGASPITEPEVPQRGHDIRASVTSTQQSLTRQDARRPATTACLGQGNSERSCRCSHQHRKRPLFACPPSFQ